MRDPNRLILAIAASCLALLGPPRSWGGEGDLPPPVLDALFPDGRRTQSLEALLESFPLDPALDFQVAEIGRDSSTSHHLVWIRSAEEPHRHERHDLWVVILRGHGAMFLAGSERPIGPGSVLYIPRGAAHAFRNSSGAPAAAYAVYAPPFDGEDRVPVASSVRAPGGSSSSGP